MSSIILSSNSTFPFIQQQMTRYIYPIYLIFGVIGCCLNILLLSRRPFQTTSCCIYFLTMSITMFIQITIVFGLYLYAINNIDPVGTIPAMCKIRYYIVLSTGMMYRWCLTTACFDRHALSTTNVRLRNFAKVRIAHRVVGILAIVWIVLPVHTLIFYNVKLGTCGIFNSIAVSLYQSIFVTLTAFILPILIMTICALLIRRNLAHKRERRQHNVPQRQSGEKFQSKRDQQVLIMLFIQMLFYGITNIPLMIMYFYNAITIYTSKSYDRIITERFFQYLAEMINFLFPVSSFYLYTMVSQMYRTELVKMLQSLVKRLWSNNSSKIIPKGNEMQTRTITGHVTKAYIDGTTIPDQLKKVGMHDRD